MQLLITENMGLIKRIFILWGIILFSHMKVMGANIEYGLSFNSYLNPANQRTSLLLDEGRSFSVAQELTLSFDILVRGNEPNFGSILHLIDDNGRMLHFSYVVDNEKNVPALIFNEGMSVCQAKILPDKWQHVKISINARQNKVKLCFDGKNFTYSVPFYGTSGLKFQFGRIDKYSSDVAPMILKDIKILSGGKLIRCWKLYKHNGIKCLDENEKSEAVATNPVWIIDNHIQWKRIFYKKTTGIMGVAFNSKHSLFYIVNGNDMITVNRNGHILKQQRIHGGYKANTNSNGFLAYDEVGDELISFSLRTRLVSRLPFNKMEWSLSQLNDSAAFYYNHAGAYNPSDSSYYFFGGYGYYNYRNDLFRLHTGSDRVERVEYSNFIPPRFAAAMGVANGKLYILGGRGNKQGKQAVDSYFYYELWSIDLKTKKAKLVWSRNSCIQGLMMAATMYYQPEKNAFYAMNMNDRGGTMYQVNLADTTITEIAKPIENVKAFQDFEYNMFFSPKDRHFYLVVDKIMPDKTHDLSIYQLATPLLSEVEISQLGNEDNHEVEWAIAIMVVMMIGVVGFKFLKLIKRGKNVVLKNKNPQNNDATIANSISNDKCGKTIQPLVKEEQELLGEEMEEKEEVQQEKLTKHFDRTKSAVSLLGTFSVYDKEGKDITAQFTPRLKELLLLLILYSEKRRHGVSVERVTEIIWFDKDEASARNNRNVTLRKLRVLLEKVGTVEILSSNGYLSIKWGKDVFCDYHTLLSHVAAYNNGEYTDSEEQLSLMLEILLYGPLLPGYETEWLDEFKDENSSMSIDFLNKLLLQEISKHNDKMVLCIADILFLHDPLNDEALAAKCQVLYHQGKKGLAKRAYDRFCKEYKDSLNEDYEVAFSELIK